MFGLQAGERDSIAIEDYKVIGIPAAHDCPCRRHTHSNTSESLSYRIALFSYIFWQFFPEIPLASSRSLIKTTINGKTLLFPKCKINSLRVGAKTQQRKFTETHFCPDQSEITVNVIDFRPFSILHPNLFRKWRVWRKLIRFAHMCYPVILFASF